MIVTMYPYGYTVWFFCYDEPVKRVAYIGHIYSQFDGKNHEKTFLFERILVPCLFLFWRFCSFFARFVPFFDPVCSFFECQPGHSDKLKSRHCVEYFIRASIVFLFFRNVPCLYLFFFTKRNTRMLLYQRFFYFVPLFLFFI